MKDNRKDYIIFSTILIGLTMVFASLGYPIWVFPATVLMCSIIFFMYLKSSQIGEKHHVNALKQEAIKEEIQDTYNAKITYRVIKGLLNILPSPYILIDRNGRITFINSEAKGIVPDFHAGSHISNVFRSPIFLAAVENAIKKDKQVKLSFEVQSPQFRQFSANIFFISSNKISNNFNDIFIQLTDDSTHIRAEKMRTDFVANASHELRTPLASITGFIETLQGPAKNDPKAKDLFLNLMAKQAGKMELLIKDLMSLSKLEILETKPITSVCSLSELISDLTQSLQQYAQDNNVKLVNNISKKMMPIMGEVDQLRQLFSNLIENAIKYSGSECEVKIFLSKEKHKGMVGIVIEDNGRGISAEHLPRLTERFYRANTNSEAEKEGTGLGLAIVKHILIRHRGKLQIDSKLGKGSQFTAWLPKGNLGKKNKKEK